MEPLDDNIFGMDEMQHQQNLFTLEQALQETGVIEAPKTELPDTYDKYITALINAVSIT